MQQTCTLDGLTHAQFAWLAQAGNAAWAWYSRGVGYFLFTNFAQMLKFSLECDLVLNRLPVFVLFGDSDAA